MKVVRKPQAARVLRILQVLTSNHLLSTRYSEDVETWVISTDRIGESFYVCNILQPKLDALGVPCYVESVNPELLSIWHK